MTTMKISILLLLGATDVYGFPSSKDLPISTSNIGNISPKVKRGDDAAILKLPLGFAQVSSSIHPQENFFHYANGNFLDKFQKENPNDEWSYLTSLIGRQEGLVNDMIEKAASIPGDNSIGDLYISGINEKVIENAGLDPIKDLLGSAQGLTSKEELIPFVAKLHREGYDGILFNLAPLKDSISSGQTIAALHEGSFLGFPGMTDKHATNYLQELFKLFGEDEPEKRAKEALKIDSFLDQFQATIADRRNSDKQFNIITYEELEKLCNINWEAYFETTGVQRSSLEKVIINNTKYFRAISEAIETFDLQHWRSYLIIFIIQNSAKYLSNQFANAHYATLGYGNNVIESSRKDIVLTQVAEHLKALVGKRYVETYFTKEKKQHATEMVKFLKEALQDKLEHLDWLEESTRENALQKLEKMTAIVGYPDEWEDFNDLHLDHKLPYYTNIRRIKSKQRELDIEMINKRKDVCKGEKGNYFEVNAEYNILCNRMTISAGYIQAPFFKPVTKSNPMQAAVNFAILGSTIGHEMTHGFDDNGRKHDGNGMLLNWWTEKDEKTFKEKAKTVVIQYQGLKLFQNELNGEWTLRENLADLGGVKVAFSAFQKWMKQNGRPEDIEGFSPEQIFFISYAQILSEVSLSEFNPYDPHSPKIFRVNVPLSNMQEFYDAFGVANFSQGMYRNETSRVQIW